VALTFASELMVADVLIMIIGSDDELSSPSLVVVVPSAPSAAGQA
jgi:hypothetical protein